MEQGAYLSTYYKAGAPIDRSSPRTKSSGVEWNILTSRKRRASGRWVQSTSATLPAMPGRPRHVGSTQPLGSSPPGRGFACLRCMPIRCAGLPPSSRPQARSTCKKAQGDRDRPGRRAVPVGVKQSPARPAPLISAGACTDAQHQKDPAHPDAPPLPGVSVSLRPGWSYHDYRLVRATS